MREATRSLPTITASSWRENDDVVWLLSRDSTDHFVNFNLYACTVVFVGHLRATRTTPLTRGRKAGNFTCPGTRCDMHIRISDQDARFRANYRNTDYRDTRCLLAILMKSRDTSTRRFSSRYLQSPGTCFGFINQFYVLE